VIGLHSAREAIKVRPEKVSEIWCKEGAERNPDFKFFYDWAAHNGQKVRTQSEASLDRLAPSHQGICVWVTETPELDLDELSAESNEPTILLALDEISDPHNVGALLRTAWLLDVRGVIVPDHRTAHLTPAVIKVASGGAEHVPLVVTKHLPEKGFWIYGLAGEGRQTLPETKFHEKVVLVIGSEDRGLRSTVRNNCDELVAIPQSDSGASFNASVAGSIALYEVRRQRL
jgi:23S rRNA (guanosine2251-2'-O)-methyltransferase